MRRIAFGLLFGLAMSTAYAEMKADYRISFGSCAMDYKAQPIWADVRKSQPDIFLFIGDNHYADVFVDDAGNRHSAPVSDPATFDVAYGRLLAYEEFARLKQSTPILATWDDHDYGANDAGKEFPLKVQSQKAFVEFFEFPAGHPIHQQQGVYHSQIVESEGNKIQFILLDTRYHRDALDRHPEGRPKNKGPYIPTADRSRTLLGETQWEWLKTQLQQAADLRFIISSVQIIAYQHGWESWGNMPHERTRLYQLIKDTQADGVVFLSGDRHLMEVSKDDGRFGTAVPYTFWDFTSSGINQSYAQVKEENQFRVGSPIRDTHYANIDIFWNKNREDTRIVFTALTLENKPLQSTTIRLGDLQGPW